MTRRAVLTYRKEVEEAEEIKEDSAEAPTNNGLVRT